MAARKNEWLEGRKIRLLQYMETRGGTKFPKGIICLVTNVYRGEMRVEVLPDDRPRCPWGCTHLSKVHAEEKEGCGEGRCACRWFPGTMEVDPEVEATHEEAKVLDAYNSGGRKDDQPTVTEGTHPDDVPRTKCDCGKVELAEETEVRLEPYAKVVQVSGVPTAIKHKAAGCNKVDYLGLPVARLKSKRR